MQSKENKDRFLEKILSYAGWGIGLAGLLLAIYSEFIKKDEPELEYSIVSSAEFINNHETAASLRIFVDSIDVKENNLNITAYKIKVVNKGSEHIRYDDYDRGSFGIRILEGRLLEPPVLLEASSDQITINYPDSVSLADDRFICVPNLSLDVDDYYIMRVVLLHSVDSIPLFKPEGKVLGQKRIAFKTLQQPKPSFWSSVIYGTWYVHIVRLLIYIFGGSFLSAIVGSIVSFIIDTIRKYRRRHYMKELSKVKMLVPFVREDYEKDGEGRIVHMSDIYNKSEAEVTLKYKKSKGFIESKRALEKSNKRAVSFHRNRYDEIRGMIKSGYFILERDDSIVYNKEARQTVREIYSMLESRNLLPKCKMVGWYLH